MAQKVGNTISFVRNVELHLDVPKLLTTLCVSEEHIKHIQAIQLFASTLEKMSRIAIALNDPELLDVMFKMKLLKVLPENDDEGKHFEGI